MFLKEHSYDSTVSELCQTQSGWNPCLLIFYSKAGISDIFEGHYGPATGIDTHSAAGPIDFSYLFLTSSFDWTIKLWSHKVRFLNRNFRTTLLHLPFYFPKSLNARQESRSSNPCTGHLYWRCYIYWQNPRPLYSFEDNGDYLYDVQWSPIHPALFAAVDGTGRLDLWNLNNDTEVKWLWTSILFQRLDYVLDVVDEGEGRSYFHV